MEKRGISPLIGTIITILITVTIAAVLVTLSQTLITSPAERSEAKITMLVSCMETKIDILNVCHDATNNILKVQVENEKATEITGLFIRIYDGNIVNTVEESGIGNWVNLGNLQVKTYNVSYQVTGQLDRIEVFPKIILKDIQSVCTDQFDTYGGPPLEILPC